MNFDNEFSKENKNDDIVRLERSMGRIKNKLDLFKYKKQLKPVKQLKLVKPVESYDLQPVSYYLSPENMNKMC